MKIRSLAGVALVLAFAVAPAGAADDARLARMATCQDSWLDWSKTAPGQFKNFADQFRVDFTRSGNDPFFVPRTNTSIAGLRVLQAFPQSVGMGVGFSVLVDAGFEKTRKIMEGLLGKRLTKCDASDGMHTCELDVAEQRTFALMAADNAKNTTLVGCFYYYEK